MEKFLVKHSISSCDNVDENYCSPIDSTTGMDLNSNIKEGKFNDNF